MKKIIGIAFLLLIVLIIGLKLNTKYEFLSKNKTIEKPLPANDLDIVFGEESAPLTIFLYFRYDCVFCQKFFAEVFPQLKSEYLDDGKVKLVVKVVELNNDEYVLNSLKTVVCINKYGDIEKLHKLLLTDPNVVYTKEFMAVTEGFVERDAFVAECMLDGNTEKYISENAIEFKQLGLTGTPTFIIKNKIYKGFMKYPDFRKAIEKEMYEALE